MSCVSGVCAPPNDVATSKVDSQPLLWQHIEQKPQLISFERPNFMRVSRWMAAFLLSIFLFGSTLAAQARSGNPPTLPTQVPDASQADPSVTDPEFGTQRNGNRRTTTNERAEKLIEKERAQERWRDIKKRSEQLLEVATELKQYVDRSGENVLSLEVIKKAEQMEKLSKDLQKKMKNN
jgi:hypothetical protein